MYIVDSTSNSCKWKKFKKNLQASHLLIWSWLVLPHHLRHFPKSQKVNFHQNQVFVILGQAQDKYFLALKEFIVSKVLRTCMVQEKKRE